MTDDPLAKVSADLRAIADLSEGLLTQAVAKANDREMPGGLAMVALGHVASPEAWEHRQQATERTGRAYTSIEDEDGETELQLLTFWSEQWRVIHGRESDRRPTIASEVEFIRGALDWALQNEPHFEDFARDVRQARLRLENVLYDGKRTEATRVPCNNVMCDERPMLVKIFGNDEHDDRYRCLACRKWYDAEDLLSAFREQLRSEGSQRFLRLTVALWTLAGEKRPARTVRKWLAPPKRLADVCPECGRRYEVDKRETCEVCGQDDDEPRDVMLMPEHEDIPDTQSYCEVGTRQTWVWWPSLWSLHLATDTRKPKRKDAA